MEGTLFTIQKQDKPADSKFVDRYKVGVLDAVRDFHRHRKSCSQSQKREAKTRKGQGKW